MNAIVLFQHAFYVKLVYHFLAIVAIVLLLIGLGMVAGNGFYIFQIFDDYAAGIALLVIALFQCIGVAWVYGNERYRIASKIIHICYKP